MTGADKMAYLLRINQPLIDLLFDCSVALAIMNINRANMASTIQEHSEEDGARREQHGA